MFELFKQAPEKEDSIGFINSELEKIKIDHVDKKMQAVRAFSRYKLNEGCYGGHNVWFLKATRFN